MTGTKPPPTICKKQTVTSSLQVPGGNPEGTGTGRLVLFSHIENNMSMIYFSMILKLIVRIVKILDKKQFFCFPFQYFRAYVIIS